MNIREEREAWERAYLSPYASRSSRTRGRDREEQKCRYTGLNIRGTETESFIPRLSDG